MGLLDGRTALVTGAGRGIGREEALLLAAEGAHVTVNDVDGAEAAAVVAEITAAGGTARSNADDVSTWAGAEVAVGSTIEAGGGRLDVLVNNAGRSMRGNIADTTPEQFRELLELNLIALVRCTRAALPHLLAQKGHVVNIGSLAAKSASRWVGAYPATKHAVAAYSQQLRLELGPKGLHVLLVCPGPIVRKGLRLFPLEGLEDIPARARGPGAGLKVPPIPPEKIARDILRACQRRRPELIVPWYARILFALLHLWPTFADWLVLRNT